MRTDVHALWAALSVGLQFHQHKYSVTAAGAPVGRRGEIQEDLDPTAHSRGPHWFETRWTTTRADSASSSNI